MTWADLVMFIALEAASELNSPTYKGIMPISQAANEKRAKLIENYPVLQAYYKRVREHPNLEKYFKERKNDVLF